MDPLISDFDQPLFSNDMVTSEAEPLMEPYAAVLSSPAPENANSLLPTHAGRKIHSVILRSARWTGRAWRFFLPYAVGCGSGTRHPAAALHRAGGSILDRPQVETETLGANSGLEHARVSHTSITDLLARWTSLLTGGLAVCTARGSPGATVVAGSQLHSWLFCTRVFAVLDLGRTREISPAPD